jgi:hypothetical protein
MFDSNAMHELQHLARDRYQRAGGGGGGKVYNSSRTYDESRGVKEMSVWQCACYEANMLWRSDSRSAVSGFKWDCLAFTLDRNEAGDVPF